MRRGDRGRRYAVVRKPGMDEPEPVWVRHGELSDELLGRVRAASAQQSTMSTCMREEVVPGTYFGWLRVADLVERIDQGGLPRVVDDVEVDHGASRWGTEGLPVFRGGFSYVLRENIIPVGTTGHQIESQSWGANCQCR